MRTPNEEQYGATTVHSNSLYIIFSYSTTFWFANNKVKDKTLVQTTQETSSFDHYRANKRTLNHTIPKAPNRDSIILELGFKNNDRLSIEH